MYYQLESLCSNSDFLWIWPKGPKMAMGPRVNVVLHTMVFLSCILNLKYNLKYKKGSNVT